MHSTHCRFCRKVVRYQTTVLTIAFCKNCGASGHWLPAGKYWIWRKGSLVSRSKPNAGKKARI